MTLLCVHDFATVDFILFYDLYARWVSIVPILLNMVWKPRKVWANKSWKMKVTALNTKKPPNQRRTVMHKANESVGSRNIKL
jgi:hypothetical protein